MKKALCIVDVQHDFVEGGSLAVVGGAALADRLATRLVAGEFDHYDALICTQDWHIDPGSHFSDTPDFVDSWPVHCVAGSKGAQILPALEKALSAYAQAYPARFINVKKGHFSAAYSGFEGVDEHNITLDERLKALEIQAIDVLGIATDYCVAATALDAARLGYHTRVLLQDCVGISAERIHRVCTRDFPSANIQVIVQQ